MIHDNTEPPSTKRAIAAHIAELERDVTFWKSINTGCRTCDAFTGRGCKLAGGVMPPDDVIPDGCPSWVWDRVPFS